MSDATSSPAGEPAETLPSRALDAVFDRAPAAFSVAAFLVGAAALAAAAAPAIAPLPGFDLVEHFIDEAPEFSASVAGVVLMALAIGLRRRLDTAWAAAIALLVFLAGYAVVRHEHYPAAIACGVAAAGLAASRRAFFRHARFVALAPTRGWYVAAAVALMAAVVGGLLWASERPGFVEAPWWALLTDPRIGRPGRALALAASLIGAFSVWTLFFAPHRRAPPPPQPGDLARAAAIAAHAEAPRPEAALAFLKDKSFLFVRDDAFIMYARSGGSLIAMGGPVGKRAAWREALTAFRAEAERASMRPVIYGAPPDLLPDLLDLGFKVEKVGENAIVDLKTFTIAGPKRQTLRNARRKFVEREAATFTVETPPHEAAILAALQPISDAWLAAQSGGEKGFSLGRFDPDYVARGPIAVVRAHGAVTAFATLWTTPDGKWASVDLMRHSPEAPRAVMDFLFAELLLWAQAEKYEFFDMGMAPLSGLAEERYAPLFARIGRFVFERAGAFYNFEGLRKYKEKFTAVWEPRYLAAPGAWSMPIVLAEAALLTAGGAAAMLGQGRKLSADRPRTPKDAQDAPA
ncbi:MAG: phosphatidylglycerol lysyltransferase domain-containing protein [Hyphomonadaceae bacterium]